MLSENFFSKKTADWTPEPNPLSNLAARLRAEGRKIQDLTVSNPTVCGFRYLSSNLLKHLERPENLLYSPDPRGLLEARKAICRYYREFHSAEVNENQIFITANTSEAYSFVFKLLTNPGDSLLTPKPTYPLLQYLAELHDLRLETYTEPEKIRESSCRALLLVHPNNPTGKFVSKPPRVSIPIIADEVFLDYALEEKRATFADLKETLCFTLSGISKILGLPQMKLSWIVVSGPEELRNLAIEKLEIIADTYLSASTPVQNALPAWLAETKKIQTEIRARISANARAAAEIFKGSPVSALLPEGGWNMILKMPESKSDDGWALKLLEEKQVLTHPGYLFDYEEGSFLVISLILQEEIFKTGVEKIKNCAEKTI